MAHEQYTTPNEKNFFHIPFFMPPAADVFARRAERFDQLAADESSSWRDYLVMLATVCRAQHQVLTSQNWVTAQAGAHLPQADGQEIPEALFAVFQAFQSILSHSALPAEASSRLSALAQLDQPAWQALAAQVLQGAYDASHQADALWVQAAAQIWWTAQTMGLSEDDVPTQEERSVCPCCGSEPTASVVLNGGELDGLRYLHCPTCNSRWHALRAKCTFCGDQSGISLQTLEPAKQPVYKAARAESCEACQAYRKLFLLREQIAADPVADDLASLALDILMGESGYARGGHNPFLVDAE